MTLAEHHRPRARGTALTADLDVDVDEAPRMGECRFASHLARHTRA